MFDIELKPNISYEELSDFINSDPQLAFAYVNGFATVKRQDNRVFIRVNDDG